MTSGDFFSSAFLGSSAAARFAASLFVGSLLLRFSRPNAIQLRFWGAAWVCLGIQVLGAAAELALVAPQPPALSFHLSALASALGTYGYLVCLILGAFELPGRRPLTRSAHIALIVTGSCLALISFLSFYVEPSVSPAVLFARRQLPLIARTIALSLIHISEPTRPY